MADFDGRKSLEQLQTMLDEYGMTEHIEGYSEVTFINDVLYFLGKSIDDENYGWAQGFRKFLASVIYPNALRAHEDEKANFTRKLGMRRK